MGKGGKKKKLRVLGYGRVSTRGQFLKGTSAKEQKASVKKECSAKGWELINFVSDDGVSGKTVLDRPAIKKIQKLAEADKFDRLMFTKFDRVGRSFKELQKFWGLIEDDLGKQIYCIDYPMVNDPKFGELIRAILGWFAQWERDLILERTRLGQLAKWQEGKSQIGKPPYGYEWKNGKPVKYPKETKFYENIVSKYLDEHYCYADIALWLTNQDVPTRLGANRWSDTSVGNILKNPAYKGGIVIYNRYDRKGNEKPKDEWVEVTFPTLISKDRWNQIQERIQLNKRKPKKTHKGEYKDRFICNEILWCGECGSKIKKHLKKQNGKLYPYYMCDAKNRSEKNLKMQGRKRCTLKSPNADMIDDEVWERVKNLLSSPRSFIEEWLKDPDRDEIEAEYARIKKNCEDLEKSIKRNTKDLSKLKSTEPRKQMIAQLNQDGKELESKRMKLTDLESEMEFYDKKEDKIKEFEKAIDSFRKAHAAAPNKMKALKVAAKETAYKHQFQFDIMTQLDSLPKKDQKRLIEAVVKPEAGGKIIVQYPTGYDLANDEQWNRMTKEELGRPLYNYEPDLDIDFNVDVNGIIALISSLKENGLLNKSNSVFCRLEKQISISPPSRTGCL